MGGRDRSPLIHHECDGKDIVGRDDEAERETHRNRQHEKGEKRAQLLATQFVPCLRAELSANHAADHQKKGKHHIDGLGCRGVQNRRHGGHEDDLKKRGADNDVGRHLQEVDHRRNHDETAAHPHDRGKETDQRAEGENWDNGEIEFRLPETGLIGQAMHPIVLAGFTQSGALAAAPLLQRLDAFNQHQTADGAQKHDVKDGDAGIKLTCGPQGPECLDA